MNTFIFQLAELLKTKAQLPQLMLHLHPSIWIYLQLREQQHAREIIVKNYGSLFCSINN